MPGFLIEAYDPEQVLIGSGVYPTLQKYLDASYRLLYTSGKRRLYLQKDLKGGQ